MTLVEKLEAFCEEYKDDSILYNIENRPDGEVVDLFVNPFGFHCPFLIKPEFELEHIEVEFLYPALLSLRREILKDDPGKKFAVEIPGNNL